MLEMDSKLIKKLGIKDNNVNLIVEIPEELRDLFTGVHFIEETWDSSKMLDFALCFCESQSVVDFWFPRVEAAMKPDAMLWFAYPKISSGLSTDLNRDEGWDSVTKNRYKPVTAISIDDVWSALRFRHTNFVGNAKIVL